MRMTWMTGWQPIIQTGWQPVPRMIAMAAGDSDDVWSIEEIIALLGDK
jgi:hypothetical protein